MISGESINQRKYVKKKKEEEEMVRQIGMPMVWFVEPYRILLNHEGNSNQFMYYILEL